MVLVALVNDLPVLMAPVALVDQETVLHSLVASVLLCPQIFLLSPALESSLLSLVTYLPSPVVLVVQAAQVVPVTVVPVSLVVQAVLVIPEVLAIMTVKIHVRTTNKNLVEVNKEMNTKVLVVVVKKKLTVRPTSKTLACDKHVVVPAPTTLDILRRTSHWRWPAGLSASTSRSSCSLSSTLVAL
jgi:hypothetical protein